MTNAWDKFWLFISHLCSALAHTAATADKWAEYGHNVADEAVVTAAEERKHKLEQLKLAHANAK